jgi:hypothetical protein
MAGSIDMYFVLTNISPSAISGMAKVSIFQHSEVGVPNGLWLSIIRVFCIGIVDFEYKHNNFY